MSPTFLDQHPAPLAALDRDAGHDGGTEGAGGGGASLSLATDPNTGGLVEAMAARFAKEDARRMEKLNEAIRAGLDAVPGEEKAMAKGRQVCGGCGNEGHNRRSCPNEGAKAEKKQERAAAPAAEVASPRVARLRRRSSNLGGLTVAELLDQIRACKAELAERAEALRQDLEAIEKESAA